MGNGLLRGEKENGILQRSVLFRGMGGIFMESSRSGIVYNEGS